jgi:hypothetical protein
MKTLTAVLAVTALLAPLASAHSQSSQRSFNFNAASVSGIGTGEVRITGGGQYDPVSGTVKAGGSFRVSQDISAGPLAGLKAGEGVKWDADETLRSFDIKCTGAEAPRTVFSGANTVIMQADFYRAGDGNQASLHAVMFVSIDDQDGGLPGVQTVWIQGVGCGAALADFH